MPPLTRAQLEDPAALAQAFPSLAGAAPAERRTLLRLMAASLALAGCDPTESTTKWVPAVVAPPGIVPGLPNRFASATRAGAGAIGVVVTHESGRPIKVDGNPLHPASLGATDAVAQALVLGFYDPDRRSGLLRHGDPSSDGRLAAEMLAARERLAAKRGAGLRILTGTVLSPTLGAAIDRVLERYPEARWHQWEADPRDAVRGGALAAYGRAVEVMPRPAAADVVVGLDSDLVDGAPAWLRHARDVAARRTGRLAPRSRILVAETIPSALGVLADRRIPATPAALLAGLEAIAASVLRNEAAAGPDWAIEAAAALRSAPGRGLLHAGPHLPTAAQALVHAVNEALGGRGRTFDVLPPAEYRPEDQAAGLATLLRDMMGGRVDTLLMLDVNPVHTVPGFSAALARLPLSVHGAAGLDETALAAAWHVPMTHEFEAWSDLRAADGTISIVQPQSVPLFKGRSPLAVLALLDGEAAAPAELVRARWRERLPDDEAWFAALADGVVPGTAAAPLDVAVRREAAALPAMPAAPLTLLFRPDPYLLDGRHANNGWLQELPRPLTKLTWENPLLLAPDVARAHGLKDGDVAAVTVGDETMELPCLTLPGLAAGCAVGTLGYGRQTSGHVGTRTGWDLFPLAAARGVPSLRRTGAQRKLPLTDRSGGFARHENILRTAPPGTRQPDETPTSLYRVRPAAPVAWGMTVDLDACIGCNACVVACTAENNVPVVGRENVLRQREMHWLRIDRYWEGDAETAQAALQPMLCMHCEEAPCETVCPVGASVHDSEGLNLQVYNRCVGTRFCSNNCPYKVRRFNFGPYAGQEARVPAARNPDVSVRARGVMEKCTFCVQRIAQARIVHDRDGAMPAVMTACQAACPTQVFTFGDLNDAGSAVSAAKRDGRNYALLPEQQTHPRVTYLARTRDRT